MTKSRNGFAEHGSSTIAIEYRNCYRQYLRIEKLHWVHLYISFVLVQSALDLNPLLTNDILRHQEHVLSCRIIEWTNPLHCNQYLAYKICLSHHLFATQTLCAQAHYQWHSIFHLRNESYNNY